MPLVSDSFVMGFPLQEQENPNYMCFIVPMDRGMEPIKLHLPEEYALTLGASYQAPFSQGPVDPQSVLGRVASAAGLQFANKAMSMQLWQGSNEMEFAIPLVLQVESDPYLDVLKPLGTLYELMLPRENVAGGLLTSPGPHIDLEKLKEGLLSEKTSMDLGEVFSTISDSYKSLTETGDWGSAISGAGDAANNTLAVFSNSITSAIKYNISLTLGNFQHFPSVVITNVQQDTKVRPDYLTGTMSRINLTVTFRTFFTPTNRDLQHLLQGYQAQWVEGDTGTQALNESSAVQSSPSNAMTQPEKASITDLFGNQQITDPIDRANYRSAWD